MDKLARINLEAWDYSFDAPKPAEHVAPFQVESRHLASARGGAESRLGGSSGKWRDAGAKRVSGGPDVYVDPARYFKK